MISKTNKLINITDNINSELGFVLKNYIMCENSSIFAKKRKIQENFFREIFFP